MAGFRVGMGVASGIGAALYTGLTLGVCDLPEPIFPARRS